QWVAAVSPSSSPAAASSSEPVHTEVVNRVVACNWRTQPRTSWSFSSGQTPPPPGTSRTSQASTSEYRVGTSTGSEPSTSVIHPDSGATKRTFAPGTWARISYGPIASSGSKRSKSKITISMPQPAIGLDLDHDRDDHRTTPVVVRDPLADDAARELPDRVRVGHPVARRALEGVLELGQHVDPERLVVDARAAGVDLRAADDLAAGRVEHHDHRDEALVAEDAP